MARYLCNSCGGVYADPLPDGTRYFHACPPAWNAERKRHEERADRRDENVRRDFAGHVQPTGKEQAPMAAEGAGRTKVSDQ